MSHKLYSKDAIEILEEYNSFAIAPDIKKSLAEKFTEVILPLEAERDRLKEDLKWLRRNYEENEMLVSDYTKLKAKAEKYREALSEIQRLGIIGDFAQAALDDGGGGKE